MLWFKERFEVTRYFYCSWEARRGKWEASRTSCVFGSENNVGGRLL
jgi:hypothetical protein